MKEKKFIKLTPFKMQVLQSFPFIDEDFDAITNYELLCKVVEYLNITVDNVNLLDSDFKILYDYVHNYFDNLSVQEEINNKLDEMAEDGTLSNIINEELLSSINDNIALINSKKMLFIGDSYMYGIIPEGMTTPFTTTLKNRLGLTNNDMYIYCTPGAGFVGKSLTYNKDFSDLINDSINNISSDDKNLIKKVFILGGYNDRSASIVSIQTIMQQQIEILKTNYPNAKIYIGMIGNDSNISTDGRVARYNIISNSLRAYKKANEYGALYLTNSENILKEYNLFASDGIHPNQAGQIKLGNYLYNIIETGYFDYNDGFFTNTFTNPNFTGNLGIQYMIVNNQLLVKIDLSTITLTTPVNNNSSTGITIDLGDSDPRYFRNVFNRPLFSTPVRLIDTNGNLYNFECQISYDDTGHYKLFILSDLTDTTIQFNKVQFVANTINVNLINC